MFHYDDGLFLTRPRLAIDVRRRQPVAFVSHAHADHIGRHALALCTPETGKLYQHRLGKRRVREMPLRQPIEFGDLQLTAFPAGHCLGSAMLLADDGERRFLYTGDFKLGGSATAAAAELPSADILVMESTFGRPKYRMPPREETIDRLVALVQKAIDDDRTPVLHLYPLGKSQEITKILTSHGIGVLQQRDIFAISEIYQSCGASLGDFALYDGKPIAGCAVITSPMASKKFRVAGLARTTTFAVTGWAIDDRTKYRLGVDHAIPLSDHADFDELIETAERVGAREIFCTHGPFAFVEHLQAAGFNAKPLQKPKQGRLF